MPAMLERGFDLQTISEVLEVPVTLIVRLAEGRESDLSERTRAVIPARPSSEANGS